MNNNFNLNLLMSLMSLSILMGINSTSILFFWMSVEMNMMSFIPMIMFMNKYPNDTPMKYFLIQSFSSSLMLFFSMILYINMNLSYWHLFILMSILMKMGMFPFYQWYLNLLNNMSWTNSTILMTIQKILPFYMFMNLMSMMNPDDYMNKLITNIMMIFILLNSLTSVSLLYSTNSIKLIMGLSSLNHMSWMTFMAISDFPMWMFYYSMYSSILMSLTMLLNKFNINYINELYLTNNKHMKILMLSYMMMMMSLPPLIGFFMKSFSVMIMLSMNMNFILYLLLIVAMMMFFLYMKLFMPSLLFYTTSMKNNMYYEIQLNWWDCMMPISLILYIIFYWTVET